MATTTPDVLGGLRAAFPEICQDIDFDLAGVTVSVGMILPKLNTSVPAYYAPNGWLTALLHLCAAAGAEPGSLVAIDEVENTLHPFAIRQLIAAFRDWAEEQDFPARPVWVGYGVPSNCRCTVGRPGIMSMSVTFGLSTMPVVICWSTAISLTAWTVGPLPTMTISPGEWTTFT